MGREVSEEQLKNVIFESSRQIAALTVEYKHLRKDVDEMRATQKSIHASINEMQNMLSQGKGGLRMLMVMGALFTTAGGFITWIITHVSLKG